MARMADLALAGAIVVLAAASADRLAIAPAQRRADLAAFARLTERRPGRFDDTRYVAGFGIAVACAVHRPDAAGTADFRLCAVLGGGASRPRAVATFRCAPDPRARCTPPAARLARWREER